MFERCPARSTLVHSLLASFDAHCWLPVTSILLSMWKGTGFGQINFSVADRKAPTEMQAVFVSVAEAHSARHAASCLVLPPPSRQRHCLLPHCASSASAAKATASALCFHRLRGQSHCLCLVLPPPSRLKTAPLLCVFTFVSSPLPRDGPSGADGDLPQPALRQPVWLLSSRVE